MMLGHRSRLSGASDLILSSIDGIDRSGERLRISLHLRHELADVSRRREAAPFVCHHADGERHERNAMELAAPILPEKITRTAILFRVLKWHQKIEDTHNLATNFVDRFRRNHEDEIVTADVTDESLLAADAFH